MFYDMFSDLVKFVMYTLVSGDCIAFSKCKNIMCTLETGAHMTNITRSKHFSEI